MSRPINGFGPATLIVALIVAVGLAVSTVAAQPFGSEPSPDEAILLLRNGNLLRGRITQTGDRYDVMVDGGQIHVKASDVELYCRTLEDVYQRKRALIQLGDVREHLELAQWCQRHGLLGLAAEELAHARVLDPTHPLIPLVERRIKMSLCQPETSECPAEPAELPPSVGELDSLVRQMPPGSVEKFTQTVQPLLVNHCSGAGCHGPGSESEFRLLRIPSGRPASRRLTQRNLHSTLALVDRDNPAGSKLLTAPIRPHGSAKGAVFTDQELDQYQRIVNWVYQVAQKDGPVSPVTPEPEQELPRHIKPPWLATPAVHTAPGKTAGDHSPEGSLGAPLPGPSLPNSQANPASAAVGFGGKPTIGAATIGPSAGPPQFVPVDPFDPEIFNRRFHARILGE